VRREEICCFMCGDNFFAYSVRYFIFCISPGDVNVPDDKVLLVKDFLERCFSAERMLGDMPHDSGWTGLLSGDFLHVGVPYVDSSCFMI